MNGGSVPEHTAPPEDKGNMENAEDRGIIDTEAKAT